MDQQTIETYNQMAAEYDTETADFWDKFPHDFFDTFAASVSGPVLDVGSGPGRDGALLRDRGVAVTCLDASEAMVAMCRAKGLEAIVGDFMDLPFPDASFNGVWAYTSLLHVPKSEAHKALNEIKRVLVPGGVLGLGLIEGDNEEYRIGLKNTGVTLPRWFSYYTKEELEKLLTEHGFAVTHFTNFKPNTRMYLNFIAKKL